MWFNYVLESAILANVLAQIIKVPLRLITKKEWRPTLVLSISFCFAAVVIYDAMGIRRHAGQHAKMLNQLLDDLMKTGNLSVFQDETYQKRFKELLGHEPLETFCGTLFGIFVAVIYGIMAGVI